MTLTERLVSYIERHHPISDSKLLSIAVDKGFSESEVYDALAGLGKRVTQKVRGHEVWYSPYTPPKPSENELMVKRVQRWLKENYPQSELTSLGKPIPFYDPEHDGPTPYYSEATSRFYHEKNEAKKRAVVSSRDGNARGKDTKRSVELSETQRRLLLAQQQHADV